MDAREKPKKIAASLKSAGASDLARRLIEAFNLEDELDVTVASWLDVALDAQIASVRDLIPDAAYKDDDAINDR